jgi:hypothetical protein
VHPGRRCSRVFRDTDCGQAKAGRRDACNHAGVVYADVTSIFNQSGLRIGLLPEEEETAAFKIVQKLIIFRRKGARRGERCGLLMPPVSLLCVYLCQHRKSLPLNQWQSQGDASHLAQQLTPGSAIRDVIYTFIHVHSGLPHSPGN